MDSVAIDKVAGGWLDHIHYDAVLSKMIAGANDFHPVADVEPWRGVRRTGPVRENEWSSLELPRKYINHAPAFDALLQMSLFPSL